MHLKKFQTTQLFMLFLSKVARSQSPDVSFRFSDQITCSIFLCFIIFYYILLYFTIFYYILLYFTIFYYILLCLLYFNMFYYIFLCFTIFYYVSLYFTIFYYILLYFGIIWFFSSRNKQKQIHDVKEQV